MITNSITNPIHILISIPCSLLKIWIFNSYKIAFSVYKILPEITIEGIKLTGYY